MAGKGNTNNATPLAAPLVSRKRGIGERNATADSPASLTGPGAIPQNNESNNAQRGAGPISGPVAALSDIIENMSNWDQTEVIHRLHHAREQAVRQAIELERVRDIIPSMRQVQDVATQKSMNASGTESGNAGSGAENIFQTKLCERTGSTNWIAIHARVVKEKKDNERFRKEVGREARLERERDGRQRRWEAGFEVESPPPTLPPKWGRPRGSNGGKGKRATELEMLRTSHNGVRTYRSQAESVGVVMPAWQVRRNGRRSGRGLQEGTAPANTEGRVVNGMGSVVAAIDPGHDLRWTPGSELSWDLNPNSPLYGWRKAARATVEAENVALKANPHVYQVTHTDEYVEWVAAAEVEERKWARARIQGAPGTPGEMGESPFSLLPPLQPQADMHRVRVERDTANDCMDLDDGQAGESSPTSRIVIPCFQNVDISDLEGLEPTTLDSAEANLALY